MHLTRTTSRCPSLLSRFQFPIQSENMGVSEVNAEEQLSSPSSLLAILRTVLPNSDTKKKAQNRSSNNCNHGPRSYGARILMGPCTSAHYVLSSIRFQTETANIFLVNAWSRDSRWALLFYDGVSAGLRCPIMG